MRREVTVTRHLPAPPADLPRIVEAARDSVFGNGLRFTARDVGVSVSAIRSLLDGGVPYRKTLAKMRAWNAEKEEA